jgi:cell division protein FtsL
MAEKIRTFRDPLLRARVVTWLLYASVALSAISVVLHVLRYRLLMQMMNGVLSEAERTAAIGASNLRLETLDHAQAVPAVLVPIAFLMWVYRANGNARALGATGMRFTPGWAVGWYFVPVYNLWRPHQAMAEMWKTSANPLDWRAERTSPLLPWWWVLWIGSGLFAWVALWPRG